jgi:hypothetical protein
MLILKAKLHIETSEMSKDNIKELLLTRMQILLQWMILLHWLRIVKLRDMRLHQVTIKRLW